MPDAGPPPGPAPLPAPEGTQLARARRLRETLIAWSLALPATLLLLAFIFLPATAVIVLSVTDWQFGMRSFRFVGLANFAEVAADPGFWQSFRNTAFYCAIVVPGAVGLGLAVALAIEGGRSLRAFYRAAHFLPVMATLSAMAMAWEALLHPTVGLVNQALRDLGFAGANWLRDEATVLPTLAMIGIWQNLGYAAVLFLAGLKAIPSDLYEAAAVDGADGWLDRLRTVTLPMLGPVMMFVTVIVAIRALQVFDTVAILTKGGPGKSSETLLYTLYTESFEYLRTGYGAAVTVVFLCIVMLLTLLQARAFDRRVHYQ